MKKVLILIALILPSLLYAQFDGKIRSTHGYGHLIIGYSCNDQPNALSMYLQDKKGYNLDKFWQKGKIDFYKFSPGINPTAFDAITISIQCNVSTNKITYMQIMGNNNAMLWLFVEYWESGVTVGRNSIGTYAQQLIGDEKIILQGRAKTGMAVITISKVK